MSPSQRNSSSSATQTSFDQYGDTEWQSMDHYQKFGSGPDHKIIAQNIGKVFDFKTAPPLTFWTRFSADVTPALRAPVTEISLFTIVGAGEGELKQVEHGLKVASEHVLRNGALGAVGAFGLFFLSSLPSNLTLANPFFTSLPDSLPN